VSEREEYRRIFGSHPPIKLGEPKAFNMTEARMLILRSARRWDSVAVVDNNGGRTGLERVAWRKNVKALAEAGFLTPSAHGDWYLTDAAEVALTNAGAKP
jgi:hypothetical protein